MTDQPLDGDHTVTDRPLNLAEYLLLLCLDDRRGRLLADSQSVGIGLAGATLVELARRGRLVVTDSTVRSVTQPREVFAVDPEPPSHAAQVPLEWPLLQVWEIIRAFTKHRDAEQWINRFSRQTLRDALAASLVTRGVLQEDESTVLWIFHRTRYPERDEHPEHEVRDRIRAALDGSAPADDTTWPLISLLRSTRLMHRLFPEVPKDQVRRVATTPVGSPATRDSIAAALQATENSMAEALTATRGGASALD